MSYSGDTPFSYTVTGDPADGIEAAGEGVIEGVTVGVIEGVTDGVCVTDGVTDGVGGI